MSVSKESLLDTDSDTILSGLSVDSKDSVFKNEPSEPFKGQFIVIPKEPEKKTIKETLISQGNAI